MATLICTICSIDKPLADFAKDKKMPLGVRRQCKKCRCESSKQYGSRHKAEKKLYNYKYNLQCKEQISKQKKTYRIEHADAIREKNRRRKAKRKGNGYVVYKDLEVYERDNWQCKLCGEAIDKELPTYHPMSKSIDHIIPISLGGRGSPENVQAAHLSCNVRKGNRVNLATKAG